MMVTVAKSLDVPIKLVFPRPASIDDPTAKPSLAMLGLGDVVLPGIMIGLALRFDLFLFYLRRQTRKPATKDSEEVVDKSRYHSLAGRWSDHFWTHSFTGRQMFAANSSTTEKPFTFPKTYFTASLVGYVIGMLATLGVMHVWGHAQPALLYLVPGVLGSLWLTAIARGELNLMWDFSEASEEEDEHKTRADGDANPKSAPERSSIFSMCDKKAQDREDRMKKALGKHVHVDSESEDENEEAGRGSSEKKNKVKEVVGHKSNREVFSFSIEAPWTLKHARSVGREGSKKAQKEQPTSSDNASERPLPLRNQSATEPPGKRARLH
jgi:minor histocompatibility antigen H13